MIVYCIHFDTRRTKTKFNGKINFICNFENHFCYEGYLKEPKAVGYIQEFKIIALKGTMLKCYLILRHLWILFGYGVPFANLYLKVWNFLKPKIKVNQQNCDIYNQLTKST